MDRTIPFEHQSKMLFSRPLPVDRLEALIGVESGLQHLTPDFVFLHAFLSMSIKK